jgi:magnesium-transporting ATPase (P-type)
MAGKNITAWHSLPEKDIFEELKSSNGGLSSEDVSERQQEYGKNSLPVKKPVTVFTVLLHQFLSPLIYILIAAGIISVAMGDEKDAIFIFLVVFLNAGIGTHQEWKAEKSAAALQKMLVTTARVRRDGAEVQIPSDELVPGDIVFLESGNKVPADMRLFRASQMTADESFLTGESLASEKNIVVLDERDLPVTERHNIAYAGSIVMSGRGTGVVVETGSHTEVGKIAGSIASTKEAKPPLVLRMEQFARQITYIVIVASVLLAIIGLLEGMELMHVFFLAVALAVSAIPEGLPIAMTVALSIATNRMAKRNVIVRKLTAVEGLGSCTYIASDKTGTLTVNQQTVKMVSIPPHDRFLVSGEGYDILGEVTDESGNQLNSDEAEHLVELAAAGIMCNEGELLFDSENKKWSHYGDAVDVAMLTFGYKMGLIPQEIRQESAITGEIPFESERRYAAIFYRSNGISKVAVKGAVETLLPFCRDMMTSRGLTDINKKEIESELIELAGMGYRVIGVASAQIDGGDEISAFEDLKEPILTMLGLVCFIDPLRPEVKPAIDKCRSAGIQVGMITGDHPATALAIARELGIADSDSDVVTGAHLSETQDVESDEYIQKVAGKHVFARVSPLQKLHIVESLLKIGHFVAVTGDGVNDAPALRRANIGVAMGSGTDVAKDTASIIITDDNFASIEAGVEEGRFAYDNVRKVTYLLIATGLAEVIMFMLALIFFLPLPLLAVQLLWLNLVTNGIQDVALAFEGGEPDAMNRPPRKPTESIFDRLMIRQTVVAGTVMALVAFLTWYWLLSSGWEEVAARNMVLLLMVLLENFHVFNCRSEHISAFRVPLKRNLLLVGGVLAAQLIHVAALYIPFFQNVLRVSPVALQDWLLMLLLASLILAAMEIFKLLSGRKSPAPAE